MAFGPVLVLYCRGPLWTTAREKVGIKVTSLKGRPTLTRYLTEKYTGGKVRNTVHLSRHHVRLKQPFRTNSSLSGCLSSATFNQIWVGAASSLCTVSITGKNSKVAPRLLLPSDAT